jgi:hypothetical protein
MTEIRLEDIQADPKTRNLTFFYVIHGTIPEIEPMVAYRRAKTAGRQNRKTLKCPVCSNRLSDMDENTKVELYCHSHQVQVQCAFYIKCFHCNKEIGIKLAI